MSEKQWQLMFMQMLGNVKALIGSIGLATAFALLLITSNTLAMAARERRSETAVLRVLGFSRGSVLRVLIVEAAAYGAAGAILAVGFMNLFARLVERAIVDTQWAGIGPLLKADVTMVAVVASLAPRRRGLLARPGVQPVAAAGREPRAGSGVACRRSPERSSWR